MVFAQIACWFPGSPWSACHRFSLHSDPNYSRTFNPGGRTLQLWLPAISLLLHQREGKGSVRKGNQSRKESSHSELLLRWGWQICLGRSQFKKWEERKKNYKRKKEGLRESRNLRISIFHCWRSSGFSTCFTGKKTGHCERAKITKMVPVNRPGLLSPAGHFLLLHLWQWRHRYRRRLWEQSPRK